jgi:phenylalanyl-tRNA synthetase alpha chain
MNLKEIESQAKKEIEKAKDLKDLDEIFKKYLGKKGEIAKIFASLKNLSEDQRKKIGSKANLAKREIGRQIEEKSKKIKEKLRALKIEKERIDITISQGPEKK